MARCLVDCVLVGADRIAVNGDVANKIGTYGLAIAARHHNVPLVVVAPSSTVDTSLATGAEIAIEERAPEELRTFGGTRITPADADVFNPAFDVTPAELITAIVTEHGRYHPRGGQR
jgi:methylthioribose-1-phosphate isomerase